MTTRIRLWLPEEIKRFVDQSPHTRTLQQIIENIVTRGRIVIDALSRLSALMVSG